MSSNDLRIKLQVKQTLWSKVIFKTLLFLGRCGLISLETAVSITNNMLRNGAFKFRTDKGEWRTLDNPGQIVLE